MHERFRKSVSEINELRENDIVDRILFVTWEGRMSGKHDLEQFLSQNGVEIIHAVEAPKGGRGNIWHQMRSLEIGLSHIKDESHVLRTRSDVHIEKEFVKQLFTGSDETVQQPAGSGVFDEKIWVPYALLDIPFLIGDYAFFGKSKDLESLVNFDARYEFLYDYPMVEVRMFIDPYIQKFEFLRYYLMFDEYRSGNFGVKDRGKLYERRLRSDIFTDVLSLYYKILAEDFYINYNPVKFQDFWEDTSDTPKSKSLATYTNSFLKNFEQGPNKGTHEIICSESSFLNSHFDDKTEDVPELVSQKFDRSFEEWATHQPSREEFRSYFEAEHDLFETSSRSILSRLRDLIDLA